MADAARESRSRDAIQLGLLAVLLVSTRITWVLVWPDSAVYWEEGYRWVAAVEILEAPIQPWVDYQADTYQGGSLVLIFLIAGLFAVFGESLLALKCAALIGAVATLVALYALCRLFFSSRAALWAGIAYVAGPPLLAHSALIVMGSHGESALFSLAQLILFLGLVEGRFRSPGGWIAFGFVTGLGAWFCYTSGLSAVACGITWLLLARLPRPAELAAAASGALLGLGPWLLYNAQHDFVGVVRVVELFGAGDPIDAWEPVALPEKLWLFFARDLPEGLALPFREAASSGQARWLKLGLMLPLGAAWIASIVRVVRGIRRDGLRAGPGRLQTHRAELVFWVYAGIFLAVYLASRFVFLAEKGGHGYRLLLAPATLMLVPAAVSAARGLAADGAPRALAAAGVAVALTASLAGGALVAVRPVEERLGHDAVAHRLRGHLVRGVLLHRKYERDLSQAFEQARRVPDLRHRFRAFQGIGWGMEYRYEGTGEFEPALRAVDTLVLPEGAAVLSGLRWTAGDRIALLHARREAGTASERDLVQLDRLRRLYDYLEKRWDKIPLALRMTDRILY